MNKLLNLVNIIAGHIRFAAKKFYDILADNPKNDIELFQESISSNMIENEGTAHNRRIL